MDKMEKVELIREKTGVSYEDAKAALDACGEDVLDAIIWLERAGKTATKSAQASTGTPVEPNDIPVVSAEMVEAQAVYEESSKKSRVGERVDRFWEAMKRLCRRGVEVQFVALQNHEEVVRVPVLIPILGLIFWGATIWLLIIGLFFGLRYRIEGTKSTSVDINDMMDRAADVADDIKRDVTSND
ncbi:UBA domain-containing protein [Collinsella provencensis]|uniref:DUF4342 domain-containing protein n=1 Tax=Collinsella provencensis TaxID=1937461 RepID=UPI000C83C3DE|nr:DUF4342 domain-containing protein [Collinsella provencensis]